MTGRDTVNTRLRTILDIASRQLPAKGVDCILVGGFAANLHGYTRNALSYGQGLARHCLLECVDFVEESLRECDPVMVARQKELEEQILVVFRMEGRQSGCRRDGALSLRAVPDNGKDGA